MYVNSTLRPRKGETQMVSSQPSEALPDLKSEVTLQTSSTTSCHTLVCDILMRQPKDTGEVSVHVPLALPFGNKIPSVMYVNFDRNKQHVGLYAVDRRSMLDVGQVKDEIHSSQEDFPPPCSTKKIIAPENSEPHALETTATCTSAGS